MIENMPKLKIDSAYGVVVIQDRKLVYADRTYAGIYGYDSAEELLSDIDSFIKRVHPKCLCAAISAYDQLLKGEVKPGGRTLKSTGNHGQAVTVFVVEHVVEWLGEAAIQLTVIDVTDLEEEQKSLQDRERAFKTLITSSKQGISVHRGFKPLFVNQAWVDLAKVPSINYALTNINILDLLPISYRKSAKELYANLMNGKIDGSKTLAEITNFGKEKRYFNVHVNRVEWEGAPAIQSVIEDVTNQVLLERKLSLQSKTDALTKLFNRYELDRVLEYVKANFEHTQQEFSIVLIDLDQFKAINDTWGHLVGDSILIQVADLIKKHSRGKDTIGRWGGEEFLIVCPDMTTTEVIQYAEELRLAVECYEFRE